MVTQVATTAAAADKHIDVDRIGALAVRCPLCKSIDISYGRFQADANGQSCRFNSNFYY